MSNDRPFIETGDSLPSEAPVRPYPHPNPDDEHVTIVIDPMGKTVKDVQPSRSREKDTSPQGE